jgi:lipopolysaccharide/colanic/teichoic acid biosynthesis glycosyltransferase
VVVCLIHYLKRASSGNIARLNPANNAIATLIRVIDIILSLAGLVVTLPVLVLIFMLGVFDTGSPVFRQKRLGRFQKPFTLVKFRTMRLDTEHVASHLASRSSITSLGRFLRRTKLDELPQLWNVLKGEMSIVGPRPCLLSQSELIAERAQRGVFNVRPGITGLAQINHIDMSTPRLLACTDAEMIQSYSLGNYFKYVLQTALGNGAGDRVK